MVEEVALRSRFGFMAFHGGNLEVGTDRIGRAAAEASGASFYAVCQPHDLRWHVPSVRFRPEESTALTRFLEHVEVVITVHGYGRDGMFTSVLLGGTNRALAAHVASTTAPLLPEYEVVHDLHAIPPELRGLDGRNPVNLPPLGGVQVELPPRIRGNGPYWSRWTDGWPTPHTAALIRGLADAARTWRAGPTEPGVR